MVLSCWLGLNHDSSSLIRSCFISVRARHQNAFEGVYQSFGATLLKIFRNQKRQKAACLAELWRGPSSPAILTPHLQFLQELGVSLQRSFGKQHPLESIFPCKIRDKAFPFSIGMPQKLIIKKKEVL